MKQQRTKHRQVWGCLFLLLGIALFVIGVFTSNSNLILEGVIICGFSFLYWDHTLILQAIKEGKK